MCASQLGEGTSLLVSTVTFRGDEVSERVSPLLQEWSLDNVR